MEVWGPKLPKGWRYPVGRRPVRSALEALPDVRVRFDSKWQASWQEAADNARPVIARASFWQATASHPLVPYVELFGQRIDEYPPESAGEFSASVLPRVVGFLRDELASLRADETFKPRSLLVLWQGDHHEVEVGE